MSSHHSYKASVKKNAETGEVEIMSTIEAKEFDQAIKATLEDIRKEITIQGFRKGAAPEKLVREKVGEAALLKEAAEGAISHAYGHILEAEKIDALGYPKVSIKKMAQGNPLEFSITTAVMPVIETFDYKKISSKENAKKFETPHVTEEEVEKAIEDIKQNYAKGKVTELTDDIVKTWGDFKDVADFKVKLKENILAEKDHKTKEKKRLELVDALTGGFETIIPDVLVETELHRMVEQMTHDIERMGITFKDYLAHLKKTEDDLKKEWRADAVKRVKLDLAIAFIAKKEKISPDAEKIEDELKHAKEHYPAIDETRARSYFSDVFLNQAVFEFLEKQK